MMERITKRKDIPMKTLIMDYVQLPLPMSSQVLPAAIFMDPTALHNPHHWSEKNIPFTYWHLTSFKAKELKYACIGVHLHRGDLSSWIIRWNGNRGSCPRPESFGRPWSFPPSLKPGINESKEQTFIEQG
jgi:hypothetical protein